MSTFQGKTVFITGASRGIGLAIGVRLAREGANIAVVAKTDVPNPKLPGTIHTAAAAIEAAGGKALPLAVDIRDEAQVAAAVARTVETFGGVDVLVNNASAIFLAGTQQTPMKRFDLMYQVNVRGTFLCSQQCIPHLLESANPHILNLSPPLNFEERWFAPHVAYSIAKYGMSLCVLGMAGEFRGRIGVNALWPRTLIATAAVQNLLGGEAVIRASRTPEVMADAAYHLLCRDAHTTTGQYFLDEAVLAEAGITDFSRYAVDPTQPLMQDLFV